MSASSIILRTLDFAAHRHRSQFRKGEEKIPYINHPIQVANLLRNDAEESDPVLLAAAILHDVVEDTVDSAGEREQLIDEIRQLFGDEITELTLEVTDDKTLAKEERKLRQILESGHKSERARKLKIADKIMNIRDLMYHPPVGWTRRRIIEYLDWSESVVKCCRNLNPRLDEIFDLELDKARRVYNR